MRTITTVVAALALVACRPDSARADEPTPTLRLAEVLAAVRAENPALQAAGARARAAASVPARARALDDPTFSWEVWNAPESLRIDEADNNILKLSQRLPFPGKRRLAGRIAEDEAAGVQQDAERGALDLFVAARRAYTDLWQAYEQRTIYRRDGALAARLAQIAAARYASAQGSQADALRAEVARAELLDRERGADLEIATTAAELNGLLSRPPDQPLGVPEAPRERRVPPDPAVLTATALARRPEVAAAASAVRRAEDAHRLAERAYFPDFELSVSRFQNHDARDGFGAMASVTIPFAYRGKYDAALAEAEATLTAARADERRIADLVRREVHQAYRRAQTATIRHDLLRSTHVPQAEALVAITEKDYVAGTTDFATFGERLRSVQATHLEHIVAAADLARADADLDRAVGAPFEELVAAAGASPR